MAPDQKCRDESVDLVLDMLGESTCAFSDEDIDVDNSGAPPKVKSGWGAEMAADLEAITTGTSAGSENAQPYADAVEVYGAEPSLDEVVPISDSCLQTAEDVKAEVSNDPGNDNASLPHPPAPLCTLSLVYQGLPRLASPFPN